MSYSKWLPEATRSLEEIVQLRSDIIQKTINICLSSQHAFSHEALHAQIQGFESKCDLTAKLIENLKSVASNSVELQEARRLRLQLAQEVRSVEHTVASALQSANNSSSQTNITESDPTDALLISLAVTESREELIREREQGIQFIRKDVVALRSLFQDIAFHVDRQGTLIDSIEANVVSTSESSRMAHTELEYTRESQQGGRNRKILLLVVMVLICVVIILVSKSFF